MPSASHLHPICPSPAARPARAAAARGGTSATVADFPPGGKRRASRSRLRRAPPLSLAGPLLAALLVAAPGLLGGCAGQRATDYTRLTDRRFPPREAPARPTDKAPKALIAEGYVLIGLVEARHPVRRCFPRHCRDLGERGDPTAEAGRRAAELGGDLLVLSADDVLEQETMFYEGQCVHTGPIAPLTGNECREREIVRGVREVAVSRGTVWRHEPDLARGPQNELAWRLYVGEVPFDALELPQESGQ